MTTAEEVVKPLKCPYVGLDYYQEEWGSWFFGREADGSKIITNMQAARLTLLHAESGVGKSSLLRAGVAWRLRRLLLSNGSSSGAAIDIPVVFSSWKDDPVQALVSAIRGTIEPLLAGRDKPELPAGRLDAAIEAAADAVNAPLLVILDQFEEYFLYCSREPTPERFADQLARCVNQADLPANFLIAIREDAYASLGDLFKGRIANVYGNYLHIDYLDRASAEQAIRAPLDVYNGLPDVKEPIVVQNELVEAVLDEVRASSPAAVTTQDGTAALNGTDRVATPLLQLVMETVWKRERAEGSCVLRLSTLQKLEGVKKIVDVHLNDALNELGKSERETAIDMFDHLVTPSGGKIAESVSDLALRTGHTDKQVENVLQKLDQARVVRPVPAPPGQDPERFRRYEIFHDVLAPAINHTLAARDAQRRARRFRRLATLAAGLLIVALAVGITFGALLRNARIATRNADHQRNLAVSAQVAAESEALDDQETLIASQLAVAAWRIAPTSEARLAMLDVLAQPDYGVPLVGHRPAIAVAFSPDGKILATATATSSTRPGSARLWSVTTRQQIGVLRRPGPGEITALAFSPAGTGILATAGADGSARLWDTRTYRQIRQFQPAHASRLIAVAFSPDGKTLATASADGTTRLWNLATGHQIGQLRASRTGAVNAVAFAPNGKTLATAGADGTARLWNTRTYRQIRRLRASRTGAVNAVAFAPNGKTLATADADGTARLWNLAMFRPLGTPLAAGTGAMNAVAFSPDGRFLATAGADGTARLWNVAVYRQLGTQLAAGTGAGTAVAFAPNGKILATADADGTARLWNTRTYRQIRQLRPVHPSRLTAVAFSRDGKILATGGVDGTTRLWDVATGRQLGALQAPGAGAVNAVAFSPSGKILATGTSRGSDHRSAQLWNLATHRELGLPLATGGAVRAVAFTPDGNILATAGSNVVTRLWNVDTHAEIGATPPSNLGFTSVVFSSDRKRETLATAGNNKIRLWAVNGRRLRQIGAPLASGNEAMNAVAFSPDGQTIATANGDGTARLWDTNTHQEVGAPLRADTSGVNALAFSPSGNSLATAGAHGIVQLWNIALPEDKYLTDAACSISGRTLKRNDWNTYIKSESFRSICPGQG